MGLLRGVWIYSDSLEASRARVRPWNLGPFVATHCNRKFDRVARHRKRVLNGLAEGVDLWKCWHDNLKGVLIRFEHYCITHIHAC